jgi:hypothetical protein
MNFLQTRIREVVERSGLKLAVLCLSVLSLTFGLMLAFDLSRDPIVVERACETTLASLGSAKQTREEVEAFLREAVSVRFDSVISKAPSDFLTQDLALARAKEQEELKRSGVDQRMLVRSVKLDGDHFLVVADRLVAIDKARSAIPLLLVARIASKDRSLSNPYGLVLTAIDQDKEVKHD